MRRPLPLFIAFCLLLLLACRLPLGGGGAAPVVVDGGGTAQAVDGVGGSPALVVPDQPLSGRPLPLPETAAEEGLAPFREPVPPAAAALIPRFSPQLAAVRNPAALPLLTEAQRQALDAGGYVLLDPVAEPPAAYFERLARQGQPLLINAEWVILETAAVHQSVWRTTTGAFLYSQLGRLLETLVSTSAAQRQAALQADEADPYLPFWVEGARRNQAYLTIAARLLNPDFPVDPAVTDLVQSELDLILLGGTFVSPYTGLETDYSPYAAAGGRFERAHLWLTTVPFDLGAAGPEARLPAAQLQLLLTALQEPEAAALWEQVYRPLAFRDGGQQPRPLWQALAALDLPLDIFILTAAELPEPRWTLLPHPADPTEEIFTALTYNRVGGLDTEAVGQLPLTAGVTAVGPVRLYPRPLDLAAALGSDAALARLAAAGDTAYESFPEQLALLREQFAGRTAAGWATSASQSWLYALDPLLNRTDGGGPPYLQAAGWDERQLDMWQIGVVAYRAPLPPPGSPMASGAGGGELPHTLEPRPILYGRLAAATRQLGEGLAAAGVLEAAAADQLLALESRLLTLQALSLKIGEGRPLSSAERAFLAELPAGWPDIPLPAAWPYHTTSLTGETLSLRLTGIRPLVVITLVDGRQTVHVGGMLTWEEKS